NMFSMLVVFVLYSLYLLFIPFDGFPVDGVLYRILAYVISMPAGMVWCTHSWMYATIFAVLNVVIVTPLQYFFLRKDTKNKLLLFISILLSSIICYTCITVFFNIKY
ncbi:MAG: hypothetical protein Q4B70_17405, partial [Lachnospiraceae bacterium]|nr:hypothetical protein [Lachnospiraceae bacterium]